MPPARKDIPPSVPSPSAEGTEGADDPDFVPEDEAKEVAQSIGDTEVPVDSNGDIVISDDENKKDDSAQKIAQRNRRSKRMRQQQQQQASSDPAPDEPTESKSPYTADGDVDNYLWSILDKLETRAIALLEEDNRIQSTFEQGAEIRGDKVEPNRSESDSQTGPADRTVAGHHAKGFDVGRKLLPLRYCPNGKCRGDPRLALAQASTNARHVHRNRSSWAPKRKSASGDRSCRAKLEGHHDGPTPSLWRRQRGRRGLSGGRRHRGPGGDTVSSPTSDRHPRFLERWWQSVELRRCRWLCIGWKGAQKQRPPAQSQRSKARLRSRAEVSKEEAVPAPVP